MKTKSKIENAAVKTDINDVIDAKIDQRIKPLCTMIATEQELSRHKMNEVLMIVRKREGNRFHNVVQDVFIAALLVGMAIALQGC